MDKRDKATALSKPRNGGAGQATATGKRPDRFTYALAAYTAERRESGWYIAKTVPNFCNEKPKWSGPFQNIEHACLSIARHCATELADRHTRSIESHAIERTDGLFGLKPTTRLRAK
jgi:hypothetical protein